MKDYRIKEQKFDDERSEFFPEYYNKEYKNRMCRIEHDGWFSISEQHKKILGIGYKTYEDAMIQIRNHRKSFRKNVKEKIHEVCHEVCYYL